MRIKIAATAAESTHSFIEIGSEVPFAIIAAIMKAIAEAAGAAYVTIESEMTPSWAASAHLDPAMYGESAKVALDAITVPPVVRPPEQHFTYVEIPKELRPLPGGPDSLAESDSIKYLTTVPVDPEPTQAQKTAQAALATVKPEVLAKQSLEVRASSVQELAAQLPPDNPLVQALAAPAEAPKKRTRKAAAEVQTAGSSAVEHSADNREVAGSMPAPPTIPVSPNAVIPESQLSTTLPAQPVTPPQRKKILTDEQMAIVRPRLAKYRNDILTGKRDQGFGGMESVMGFGNPEEQLRAFFPLFRPDKPNTKEWTFEDWTKVLEAFDNHVKALGAYSLVRYIQQIIGLVPNPDDGSPAAVRK